MERSDGSAAAVGMAGSQETDWLVRMSRTAAYDVAIKAIYVLWFLFVASQILSPFLLYLKQAATLPAAQFVSSVVARGTVFAFLATLAVFTILRSRPVAKAPGLAPRVVAALGTFLVMLLPLFPHRDLSVAMNIVSALVTVTGNCLAIWVVCWLGRSLSIMAGARRLVRGGPYRYVRNPLYLAEEVAVIGAFIQYASFAAAALVAAHWLLQMARMRNEERVLRETFPAEYAAYAGTTARLIPGLY